MAQFKGMHLGVVKKRKVKKSKLQSVVQDIEVIKEFNIDDSLTSYENERKDPKA
jgi:hypothetical protein